MFKRTNQEAGQAQAKGYLQSLDGWIDEQVIEPLFEVWELGAKAADDDTVKEAAQETEQTRKAVYKAIKDKVLESYRNGQKTGPQGQSRPYRGGQGFANHRKAKPYAKDRREA
jgi:hypothetical protein